MKYYCNDCRQVVKEPCKTYDVGICHRYTSDLKSGTPDPLKDPDNAKDVFVSLMRKAIGGTFSATITVMRGSGSLIAVVSNLWREAYELVKIDKGEPGPDGSNGSKREV